MAASTRRRDGSGRAAHDGAGLSAHVHGRTHGRGRATAAAGLSAPHPEVTR
jgi:hypothetical protein